MSNLFNYKHEKRKQFKPRTFTEKQPEQKPVPPVTPGSDLEDVLNNLDRAILSIKNNFNDSVIQLNPLFDVQLISNINTLQNFLQGFFPDLPPYLTENEDGTLELSLRALTDSRDYLKNEFNLDPNDVLLGVGDGLTDKIYYRGNYVIKPDGTIWQGDEKRFDPTDLDFDRVIAIDFAKMIISVEPGVHLPFSYILGATKNFTNYLESRVPPGTEASNPEPGDSQFDWQTREDFITDPIDNPFYNELVLKNPYIEDKTPGRVIMPSGQNITLKDIFGMIDLRQDYEKLLKDFVVSPKFNPDYDTDSVKGSSTCNLKDINYFWLMFLLLIGGGNYENRPLPGQNNEYASINSRSDFFLCEEEYYQTGHPMMYSSDNRQGLPTSLLQICYSILSPLFTLINIPPIGVPIPCKFNLSKWNLDVEWFVITVFPGLCIFGFLEHFIFWLQEWCSDEIRDMFRCEMEYLTPVTNSEGVGLDFLESNEPICQFFHRDFKICLNNELGAGYRSKAGFYFCSNSGNCPRYIAEEDLYNSNKESTGIKEEDIYSSGSAVNAILKEIDKGENVSFQGRG